MFQSLQFNWIRRQSTLSVAINQEMQVEDVFFISVRRKIFFFSMLTVATPASCTQTYGCVSPTKKVLYHSHLLYAAVLAGAEN